MEKRNGKIESKIDDRGSTDFVFYINDVYLIAIILNFLTQSEIRRYSYSSTANRDLILQLGLIKYMLNSLSSIDYYRNGLGEINKLGQIIAYQVLMGAKIVSLDLSGEDYEVLDVIILGHHLEKLNLFKSGKLKDVSNLGYVRELDLTFCSKVRDVRSLGKVYKLSIGGTYGNRVTYEGIEALSNVYELYLGSCTVTDVSPLANIHTLTLDRCDNITEVSPLSNIHTLTLDNCRNITDVSPLANIHTLTLQNCDNITDVSPLANIHTLNLLFNNITNVSPLEKIHTLTLQDCDNITDVSPLSSVINLTIKYCSGITDVSMLTSVDTLQIINCYAITNWGSITHQFEYST